MGNHTRQSGAPDVAPPLPHNVEAERCILGAILLDNAYCEAAAQRLQWDDFFLPQHKTIFRAMLDLQKAGRPIDVITLLEELTRAGMLEAAGGLAYLSQLADGVPRVTNVPHYAEIVREKRALRELVYSFSALQQQALAANEPPAVLVARGAKALADLAAGHPGTNGNGGFAARSYALEEFLVADFPPREHLIEGIVGRHATHMVIALPHRLKSWFTTALALGATTQGLLMGKLSVERPVRTYLAQLEDWPGELRDRLRTLASSQQFLDSNPKNLQILPQCDLDLTQDAAFNFLLYELKKFQPDLLILDVLRKFFGGDVNSPKETAAFLRRLDLLQRDTGASVILVHHENRKKEEIMLAAAGSYNWAGWANVMIHFTRKSEVRTATGPISSVEIEVDTKLGPSPEPMRLILDTSVAHPLRLEAVEDGTGFEDAMSQLGEEWDVKSLAEVLGVHRTGALRRVKKWLEQGKIEKIRGGKRGRGRTMAMYRSLISSLEEPSSN